MRYFANTTPRQLLHRALRIFYYTVPLVPAVVALWWWHPPLIADRPFLVLMGFLVLLAVVACSLVVAAVASCHMAVSRAFAAGLRAGANPEPRVSLRVVE